MPALQLPALPFSILMPALSLLLVFRTNTGYFRWNEARTLWGGLINTCRNVVRQSTWLGLGLGLGLGLANPNANPHPHPTPNQVRQSNTFFPDDAMHNGLKRRMAAETSAFIYALRNFLRGPADDDPNPYPHPNPNPNPIPNPDPTPNPNPNQPLEMELDVAKLEPHFQAHLTFACTLTQTQTLTLTLT